MSNLRKWSDLSEDRQQVFERYFEDDFRSPKTDFVRIRDLELILGEELFKDFLLTYDLDCTKIGTYLGQFQLGDKEEIVGVVHTLHYYPYEEA